MFLLYRDEDSNMDVIVSYDIGTDAPEGRKRLRQMAQVCKDFGQRVQLSVFECSIDEMGFDALLARLKRIIEPSKDSLRVYKLLGGRERALVVLGRDRYVDFSKPLIV